MENSEIEQLRAVWALVNPDKVHHGVEILIKLFDRYPETKDRFARLNCSTPEAMRGSTRMKAHAGRVVTQLGAIIECLDDMDLVDETIYLLGENHNKRKIQAEDFQKFNNVFLDYLKDTLPAAAYPPEAAAAYTKFMGVFNKKMGANLDQ